MTQISITKASLADTQTLVSIGRETFFETFAEGNTQENMQKFLDETFTEDKVRAEISNPDSLHYIAWEGEVAIGYLKLNHAAAQTELQDENSLEIARIYVKSAYHGKQVGQLLFEKALAVAAELGKSSIWLGVWEENPRAIRFYEKNGFTVFDKHTFIVGDDEQTDLLMKKIIRS